MSTKDETYHFYGETSIISKHILDVINLVMFSHELNIYYARNQSSR